MKSRRSGFTLMEVLVAIAIVVILAGFGTAIDARSYIRSSVDAERDSLRSLLATARSRAMANIGGSDHGLFIGPEKYIVFEGASYASRNADKDQEFPISGSLALSGASEIVFSSLEGSVASPATITVSAGGRSITVFVNQAGAIR